MMFQTANPVNHEGHILAPHVCFAVLVNAENDTGINHRGNQQTTLLEMQQNKSNLATKKLWAESKNSQF